MSKKIQLTIPTPCHEDWDAMTPVEKGKFCGSCQKQVVDFSNMSDRQIAEFFKKPSTGSVCGRFMGDQLERDIDIPRKRIPWVKYLFQVLLPAIFISKASAQKTLGKVSAKSNRSDTVRVPAIVEVRKLGMILPRRIEPVIGDTIVTKQGLDQTSKSKTSQTAKPDLQKVLLGRIGCRLMPFKQDSIDLTTTRGLIVPLVDQQNRITITVGMIEVKKTEFINGQVLDETGSPLPGVNVMIKETRKGTATDNNGFFKLNAKLGATIVVSGAGLLVTEYVVGDTNNVKINVHRLIMGEIIRKPPRKELINVPIIKETYKDTASKYFKVFPNPIPTGSNLTIEWRQSEEGYFTLQLLNSSGQSVHQQQLWIDADARLLNIDLPVVASGNYFLAITSKKTGKRFTEKLIIQ